MAGSMIAFGARCLWWDSKDRAAENAVGLPCCPHCDGVLYEQDEDDWWAAVDHANEADPSYRRFAEWARGKCFLTVDAARTAFAASEAEGGT
jgi:hypothetical protein